MIEDLERLYDSIRLTRKVVEEDPRVPDWVWSDLLRHQDTLRAIIDEATCPVCHNTGITYDSTEKRDVPCGGLGCTVVNK